MDTQPENDVQEAVASLRLGINTLRDCAADEFSAGNDTEARRLRRTAERVEKALAAIDPTAAQ